MSSVFWKYVLIIGLIIALGLSLVAIGWVKRGEHDAQGTAQKEDKQHAQIEQKVMALPDPALNKRLCSKWMRSPCAAPAGGHLPPHLP